MTTYPRYRLADDGLYEYQLGPGEMWHGVSADRAETEASAEREAARWRELAQARAEVARLRAWAAAWKQAAKGWKHVQTTWHIPLTTEFDALRAELTQAQAEIADLKRAQDRLLRVALDATALRVHLENTNKVADARFYDALCDSLDGLNGLFTLPKEQ